MSTNPFTKGDRVERVETYSARGGFNRYGTVVTGRSRQPYSIKVLWDGSPVGRHMPVGFLRFVTRDPDPDNGPLPSSHHLRGANSWIRRMLPSAGKPGRRLAHPPKKERNRKDRRR